MRGFMYSPFKTTKTATLGYSISKKVSVMIFRIGFQIGGNNLEQYLKSFLFPILEGFKEFYQNYQLTQSEQNNETPILLPFFSKFYLSWIMAWDLKLLNNPSRSSKPKLPCLFRSYKVKWWQEFNAFHAHVEKIQN